MKIFSSTSAIVSQRRHAALPLRGTTSIIPHSSHLAYPQYQNKVLPFILDHSDRIRSLHRLSQIRHIQNRHHTLKCNRQNTRTRLHQHL